MTKRNNTHLQVLTRLGLLIAIELVMKAIGLGSVPVGPLYMSFLTLPIAVGAITMGPVAGLVLGAVFGLVSFYDAVSGGSAMTSALFQVSPLHTLILCVGTRLLMGLCVGLIYEALRRLDKKGTWSCIISAMCAPLLNTLFFMGVYRAGILSLRLCAGPGGRQRRVQSPDVRGAAGGASRAWLNSWSAVCWAASWPGPWSGI